MTVAIAGGSVSEREEVGKKKKECRERVVNRNRGVSGQRKRKSDSISYTLHESISGSCSSSLCLAFFPSIPLASLRLFL